MMEKMELLLSNNKEWKFFCLLQILHGMRQNIHENCEILKCITKKVTMKDNNGNQ